MLELDHDNLRLALTRLADRATQPDDLLRMTVALRRFWHTHNHHQECLSHLEPLDAAGAVPDLARAEALSLAAEIVRFSDAATARRYGEEALALAKSHGATPSPHDAWAWSWPSPLTSAVENQSRIGHTPRRH